MGRYMRKAKATGEVAVMEVSQSSLGVRTRAKTLALRKLQKSPSSSPSPSPSPAASSGSYLQLRSRRLEKPPPPPPPVTIVASSGGKQRQVVKLGCARNPSGANSISNSSPSRASQRPRAGHVMQEGSRASDSVEKAEEKPTTTTKTVGAKGGEEEVHGNDAINGDFLGVEASFGENVLEFEGRERSTRESTPCSLIRDPDAIRTPGSTTRPTNSAETNRRMQNSSQRHIPTAHEMDEFFAGAEVEQQKQFIEKYNFDPVNDKPLRGRYEWVKVDS